MVAEEEDSRLGVVKKEAWSEMMVVAAVAHFSGGLGSPVVGSRLCGREL